MKDKTAIILVQEIDIRWTANSRSAQDGAERNAIPEGSVLPFLSAPQYSMAVVHDKERSTRRSNRIEVEELIPAKRYFFGSIWLSMDENQVSVTFAYNPMYAGAPYRTAYPRQVLKLDLGEWGRVRYNGRFSQNGGPWIYAKTVFNIGYFSTIADIPTDVFLGEPKRTFSEMADLYNMKHR